MREFLIACGLAVAVLGPLAILASGIGARLDAIDARLADLHGRVVHVETMVELLTDRVLPYGGQPVLMDAGCER